MDYKKIEKLHYVHLSKANAYTLLQEQKYADDGINQIKRALEIKKNIEVCKKAFYKLFDDHTRRELIKIDRKVNKVYNKLIRKMPGVLENRNLIKIGLDHDDNLVTPEYGTSKTYRGIFRFKREKDEFVLDQKSIEFTSPMKMENIIEYKYGREMQELAKLLYLQEEYVKLAIETSLRDKRLRELAIESALYIGYINGYLLDGAKKIIK